MPPDLDEYRTRSLDSWDRFAGNWEREHDFLWSATGRDRRAPGRAARSPARATPCSSSRRGPATRAFSAAERIGADGKLISTDFAPAMVEVARRAGEARGLDNVEYRVLDAERMDLDDSSVDGVLCRFGYMLMADPAAALAETRRVLRDGGRLSFAVWAGPDRNLWAAIPGMTMVERGHLPPPEPGAPGIFAMGDPNRIRELVTGAGFGEPEIEEVEIEWGYDDPDVHWEMTLALAAPIADAFDSLSEDGRTTVARRRRPRRRAARRGRSRLDGIALTVVAE